MKLVSSLYSQAYNSLLSFSDLSKSKERAKKFVALLYTCTTDNTCYDWDWCHTHIKALFSSSLSAIID